MVSRQTQRWLGAHGLLPVRRPDKHAEKRIRNVHLDKDGYFQHKNPRNGGKKERIQLEEIKRFRGHKTGHVLKGTSPYDGKPITKIIHHK